ncbi:MAG: hypothetical protein GX761_02490 [Gammaproteobacteria bacterium]|nr:hypothetical protein [Gammaproteobacteria bacterium]
MSIESDQQRIAVTYEVPYVFIAAPAASDLAPPDGGGGGDGGGTRAWAALT